MYLEALDKASWSLFPQSLEQDLAKGETFTDANEDGFHHLRTLNIIGKRLYP